MFPLETAHPYALTIGVWCFVAAASYAGLTRAIWKRTSGLAEALAIVGGSLLIATGVACVLLGTVLP